MQKIIVLRGAPSSGKTTIARKYRNFENKVAWLKVDNFKDFFAEDATPALEYVNGSAIATLEYLLEKGFSVVMDGVFQDLKPIDKTLELAKKYGVVAKVFELRVSLQTLLKRDLVRAGVPEGLRKPLGREVIAKIYEAIKNNPYKDAISLDTENNSPDECESIINASFT